MFCPGCKQKILGLTKTIATLSQNEFEFNLQCTHKYLRTGFNFSKFVCYHAKQKYVLQRQSQSILFSTNSGGTDSRKLVEISRCPCICSCICQFLKNISFRLITKALKLSTITFTGILDLTFLITKTKVKRSFFDTRRYFDFSKIPLYLISLISFLILFFYQFFYTDQKYGGSRIKMI